MCTRDLQNRLNPLTWTTDYCKDFQKRKRLQPNTVWLQVHWPGLQIAAKTTKCMEWAFKKVKDFNQTQSDYKPVDLDYKSLQTWTTNHRKDYKKRSGMYGMDLQKGERLQPNTIWLQINWLGLQITERTTKSGQAVRNVWTGPSKR